MNDYRNYQRHRRNKHFSKRKHLPKKNIPKKHKLFTKTQFVTRAAKQHECLYLEQEVWEYIERIDDYEKSCLSCNIDDLAFIKAIVIDKINKYSTFEFLQKLDLDIWRYIIIQNFLYPHEIYGTLFLINNYFNQLFDKHWLLNKLSSGESLISYYQGLLNIWLSADNSTSDNIDDIAFYRSMIKMICKLDKMKDDLDCIDSLCKCVNSSDWKHMHHDCDNQLCNSKMEKKDLNLKNCNLAGTAIEITHDSVTLKFLECVCSHNEINVRNDIPPNPFRFWRFTSSDLDPLTFESSFDNSILCPVLDYNYTYHYNNKMDYDMVNNNVILKDLRTIYLARRDDYSIYDNKHFQNYYKRINDTLFLLTLLHYPPMKNNLLLIKKYGGKQFNLRSRLFSKNMKQKWNNYVTKLFASKVFIGNQMRPFHVYFKSIRSAQNGILKLDESKMEESVNELIYANTGDDQITNSDNCQLILVSCDNLGQINK